ncbi:MAG: hypothetical protein JRI59_06055 [Deltaproteobacteria bacterium]|nr:hypothetical protein [Deltaproteobacteria bacterium]
MLVKVDEDFFKKLERIARGLQEVRLRLVSNHKRLRKSDFIDSIQWIDATFEDLLKAMSDLDPDYFRERMEKLVAQFNEKYESFRQELKATKT